MSLYMLEKIGTVLWPIKKESILKKRYLLMKRLCQVGGKWKDINNFVYFSEFCGLLAVSIKESTDVLIQSA